MDRSLDSIGSCSLDVDADSSDISDTSGSLNFPTPISVKDITREFTANIRERCTITTTSYVKLDTRTGGGGAGGGGGVRMASDAIDNIISSNSSSNSNNIVVVEAVEKKPSYLNLACCVNGYSNLTTYDSKIRQDINKSREVSPIRPSTSSLQYCKRSNCLAAPVLHSMPLTKQPINETNNNHNNLNNNHHNNHVVLMENGDHLYCNGTGGGDKSHGSFIQQRVERLYGPGALAQVFYSPKKHSASLSSAPGSRQKKHFPQQEPAGAQSSATELSRKFKQLSPSKNYSEFHKKLHNNCTPRSQTEPTTTTTTTLNNGDVDLPVFRHLSHEFRAQLPTVSPKRSVTRVSPAPEVPLPIPLPTNGSKLPVDVVDHEPVKMSQLGSGEHISTNKISPPTVEETPVCASTCNPANPAPEKDGNYFLRILKDEQVRLLALSALAEKYIDALTNNPDITEDTFGLLRSASGKARLLATQKMKQFEGLCHNNLNRSPEDAFPTTLDDLQGFWDMVYLQVTHVDSIFAEIEQLKRNDWQRVNEPPKVSDTVAVMKSTKTSKTGILKARGATAGATANGSKPVAASNSVAAMKREAQRKQLLEMKRQRREALAAAANNKTDGNGDGAVVVNDTNTNAELQATIGDNVNTAVKNSS
ncbi:hypothetical protein ACLKA7_000621 [Drosophila subpalustris]